MTKNIQNKKQKTLTLGKTKEVKKDNSLKNELKEISKPELKKMYTHLEEINKQQATLLEKVKKEDSVKAAVIKNQEAIIIALKEDYAKLSRDYNSNTNNLKKEVRKNIDLEVDLKDFKAMSILGFIKYKLTGRV